MEKDLGWRLSVIGRTALMGLGALALLMTACTAPATAGSAGSVNTQQQPDPQGASARHAYALMVAQDKNKRDHQGDGTDKSSGGASDKSSGGDGQTGSKNPAPATDNPANHCTPVSLAANPSSPQLIGVTVTLTGTTTDCPNATYQFWVKGPTGNWTVLQAWSTTATASWNTAGAAAGNYSFDLWAKKPGSSEGDSLHISPVLLYTLQPHPVPGGPSICTSITWNQPAPASPQSPGTKVTLGGTAGGCSSPQYQFWVQAPNSTTWSILQAWSPSSTATWDTTGLSTGTYLFDIWVKDAPSSPSWEAHISPNPTYTLQTGAPCSTVTWNTPTPAQPQVPGTQVKLGGAATGCPNPEYQFWVQPQGGTWTILQAYSPSSTATWNTTGLATGTYLFDIWARQMGSPAQWEAHISPNPTDSLQMGPACTSSTLSFSPTSPSTSGTYVNLTATSAGCPNPTYEFWVQAPGGAWQVLKGYSSNNTALWITSGLAPGPYLFDVWVKNSGNSPDWEAHISPNPTYTLN